MKLSSFFAFRKYNGDVWKSGWIREGIRRIVVCTSMESWLNNFKFSSYIYCCSLRSRGREPSMLCYIKHLIYASFFNYNLRSVPLLDLQSAELTLPPIFTHIHPHLWVREAALTLPPPFTPPLPQPGLTCALTICSPVNIIASPHRPNLRYSQFLPLAHH